MLTPLTLGFLFPPHSAYPFVYEAGRSFALVGVTIFIRQVLLAGRVIWVERAFVSDMVIRHRRCMASFAACLLEAYALLLAIGAGLATLHLGRVPCSVE